MPPQAPSPFAWPILLGASGYLFPAAAVLYARRAWLRDPAGQLAIALALVFCANVAGLGQFLGVVPRGLPVSAVSNGLALVLVMGPVLTWLGLAWRDRLVAQGVAAALWTAGIWVSGAGREFGLVAVPAKGIVMTALCVAALARSVREVPNVPNGRADGRVTILGALLTYFLVNMITRPLVETLFASDFRATVDAHMGAQLVYAGCMATIAVAIARRPAPRPAAARPAPNAEAPNAAGADPSRGAATAPADAYRPPPRGVRRAG